MSAIAFHVGVADKSAYACRLLRKAYASALSMWVVAEPPVLMQLDAALWAIAPTDFVSHCLESAPDALRQRSSVVLASTWPSVPLPPQTGGLLNLTNAMPQQWQDFTRVFELVGQDPAELELARQRWRTYVALGHTPIKHEIS